MKNIFGRQNSYIRKYLDPFKEQYLYELNQHRCTYIIL